MDLDERFELRMDAGDVGRRGVGIADRDAPHGPPGDEIAAERGALEIDALRQERDSQ